MKRALYPSLSQIEQRLFGLDPDLLHRVAIHDPTLPTSFRLSVEQDRSQALQEVKSCPVENLDTVTTVTAHLPPWLQDTLQRKAAVRTLNLPRQPSAGLLLEVTHIVTPPGAPLLDWQLNSPLYAVLDEPSPENDLVWLGWMVSPDADYAGWWDVVLDADDSLIDPACAVVQLWNPVKLYWPMAQRLCGQLSATKMQVLRACAEEMLFSNQEPEGVPCPGRIGLRSVETMPGVSILCGSPLGGKDDPRHTYQEMYHTIGEALLEPARLACEQPERVKQSALATFWQQCMEWGQQLGHCVLPQEPLSLALGKDDELACCLLFDGTLRLTMRQEGSTLRLGIQNVHPTEPLCLEHLISTELQDRFVLNPDQSDSLVLKNTQTHELHWRGQSASQWCHSLQLGGNNPPVHE
jgi:hypothetical protein